MRAIAVIFVSLAFFARGQTALSLSGDSFAARHTQAELILSATEAKPGDTIYAGVDLKMEPGWHTYWKNPGDAGMATSIKWQLPPGISAGEIQWPLPKKLPPAEVTTYGYSNEVMLLVPLKIETNVPPGQMDLKANVSWLECKDVCIPQNQNVEATLKISGITQSSADETLIVNWLGKAVPQPGEMVGKDFSPCRFSWGNFISGDTRQLLIAADELQHSEGQKKITEIPVDFYPYASDQFEIQPQTDIVSTNSGRFHFIKLVKKFSGDWPKEVAGVLIYQAGDTRQGFEVKSPIADKASAGEIISSTENLPPVLPAQPLWKMLLFAFVGGLILNIMPCVLPVIALKILGFVSEARSEPRRVRNLGLIYALGVLTSFLALAGIVIGVKSAGHHAGWGMQFGSPVFVVCLTILVLLVALNLFGVFEIAPGGKILNAAGQLASKHGAPGAFFNGVLATILATPCTAPFLSVALGFAFSQNAATIILIFLFTGIGLAAPYVLLSCNPALLKFLPKPGAWMEKFKIAMGFPMLLTAVWLFNLAAENYDGGVLWFGLFLALLAFAAWFFGEFVQRGRFGKGVALAIVVLILAGDYFLILEKQLHWREPTAERMAADSKNSNGGIAWQAWSPSAVAAARAAGHPALVDFTADWCLTCQVNKKIAIEIPSVQKKLRELDAVAFTADYTHFPDSITTELNRYHRAGVPLVLVYPKNPDAEAIVLPTVLTPGTVLTALERAAR